MFHQFYKHTALSDWVGHVYLRYKKHFTFQKSINFVNLFFRLFQLALHLTSLFLESPNPLASQVFQIVIQEPFLECLINLAHSPLLRGQALDGMLRLMRAFGHLKKTDPNGRQQLTVNLF